MKKVLTSLILITGFAQIAYGNDLPQVSDVEIAIDMGPELATVQPTATITFTYASCGARNFQADTEKTGDTVVITILDQDDADCKAVAVDREYSLQVSSDATSEYYVLLNPIAPKLK